MAVQDIYDRGDQRRIPEGLFVVAFYSDVYSLNEGERFLAGLFVWKLSTNAVHLKIIGRIEGK
jgi:hypothetical protein